MTAINGYTFARNGALLLAGTMLSGVPVWAQTAPAPVARSTGPAAARPAATPRPAATTPLAAPVSQTLIKTLRVEGSQRIEPETVLSYTKLRVGIPYTAETLDQALKEARLELVALYQATVCENLAHEATLMSQALALDLIGADDFAARRP